ncbi:MAG: polysaccharide deacetylase family protein [Clostridia bacterium]|nr:polysaccharide deacetylase family protein [Clostridia bacterium]
MKLINKFLIIMISAAVLSSASYPCRIVSKIAADDKVVALTFDDGPHPKYTDEILDILSEYGVKATFFVIGKNVEEHPEIIQREVREGHEIGNHTFDHFYMNSLNESSIADEIKKCECSVLSAGGPNTKLLRPPGGICSTKLKKQCAAADYNVVLWSVDTRDWKRPSADHIVNSVLNNVSSGDIILMHDYVSGKSNTPEALKRIIPALIDEGYNFVTVSELINLEKIETEYFSK